VADAVKLLVKEDVRPARADRWVFEFAPYLAFIPVFMILVALPFAQDWGVRNLTLGMFFIFAVLGLEIVGVLMAGLGSGNKYALLGGVRAAAQMVSYEIPFAITILSVAMIVGSLDLNVIAAWQTPWGEIGVVEDAVAAGTINEAGLGWPLVVLQPLAFVIFFTAMLAELHRAPFDIPVAESEIVGGYFVEYSGIRWSMFQLSEYASLWGFSVFGSVIFFGGWAWPYGDELGWGFQLFLTMLKSFIFILAVFWVRITLPRLRIDQLMNFCWKVLIEVSFLLLLVNGFFLYYEWPQEILAIVNWLGAAALLAAVFYRGRRGSKAAQLVGTYRQAAQAAQAAKVEAS
jgi:NADH-quinone oxidoreductase subunit H